MRSTPPSAVPHPCVKYPQTPIACDTGWAPERLTCFTNCQQAQAAGAAQGCGTM